MDRNRITHYENLCNRLHDRFTHYSTVRLVVLSFCIPLGAVLITTDGMQAAGSWVVLLAYALNIYFGRATTRHWVQYRNVELYLEYWHKGKVREDYELNYREDTPSYLRFLVWKCVLPKEDSYNGKDKEWRHEWKGCLGKAATRESNIQVAVLMGIVALGFLIALVPCSFLR